MKKIMIFSISVFVCAASTVFANLSAPDVNYDSVSFLWSLPGRFDGSEITEEPMLLLPADRLAYSSAMAAGEPESLTIIASDIEDPSVSEYIFTDHSGKAVEGTANWNYMEEQALFPSSRTYLLTEMVDSFAETKIFNRAVTILPEPAAGLAILFVCALFLRKRVKASLAAALIIALSSLGAYAKSSVVQVDFMRMWPFDRSVIVNYLVTNDVLRELKVKFYGSTDNGTNVFDLAEKGTLSRDGAEGTIPGSGAYKTIWVPDSNFFGVKTDNMRVKVEINEQLVEYMVVDLSSGEISYLNGVPQGGWTDEHKTTKMVFKKIEAGSFTMGSPAGELGRSISENQRTVTLTKDFYIGVFETTQKQYQLIMGKAPSAARGDTRPVENVSYKSIRGPELGRLWPNSDEVDSVSFIGKMRAITGRAFDLPTEAQWEFSCRAGTTSAWNNGADITNVGQDPELDKLGRYYYDKNDDMGGYSYAHTRVGSYLPNAWGLYDMHGNVSEWCLDWYERDPSEEIDPKGAVSGSSRVVRGGSFNHNAHKCRSAARIQANPNVKRSSNGFRVALTL